MSFVSKITSKGQTTVPKQVRERLNLKPGDTVEFVLAGDDVVLKARNKRLVDLAGVLGKPPGGSATIEDMEQAIGDAVLERYDRSSGGE